MSREISTEEFLMKLLPSQHEYAETMLMRLCGGNEDMVVGLVRPIAGLMAYHPKKCDMDKTALSETIQKYFSTLAEIDSNQCMLMDIAIGMDNGKIEKN